MFDEEKMYESLFNQVQVLKIGLKECGRRIEELENSDTKKNTVVLSLLESSYKLTAELEGANKCMKEQIKKQKEDICKYQEEIKKLEQENINLIETSMSSVYGIDFEPCESGGLDDVRNKYQYVEYDNRTYPIPKKLYKICHAEGYRAGFIAGLKEWI